MDDFINVNIHSTDPLCQSRKLMKRNGDHW